MTYEVRNLIDSLNEKGIHVIANRQFDAFEFNFSEHDKKVSEEKDKRISELEKEIIEKNNLIVKKSQEIIDLLKEIEEIKKDWCFARMSELEDRHQSDCIRINQLLTTIDVLTERYQKLREVHGL